MMQTVQHIAKAVIVVWLLRFCYRMVQGMLEQFD